MKEIFKADITKKDFISHIKLSLQVPEYRAAMIFNDYIESLFAALKVEGVFKIHRFGKFVVSRKRARPGRNPKTGEIVEIKARKSVSFLTSKIFRKCLNDTLNVKKEPRNPIEHLFFNALLDEKCIEIRGFGTFRISKWGPRHARKSSGEVWVTEPSLNVKFKPGKILKEAINSRAAKVAKISKYLENKPRFSGSELFFRSNPRQSHLGCNQS